MKNLIAIFCFAFLPLLASAQVGYLGKRFDIQYAPTIGNPWLQNIFDDSQFDVTFDGYVIEEAKDYPAMPRYNAVHHRRKATFLNFKHRFLLNYTISSRSSIGIGYNLAKYGIYARDIFRANEDSTRFERVETSGNFEATDFILRYTKFHGYTAPIGNYFSVSVGLNKTKRYVVAKDLPGHFKEKLTQIPFIGLDLGRNILIRNGLFLNFGIAVQWSSKYKKHENYRTALYNVFRPTIGIGYIPF